MKMNFMIEKKMGWKSAITPEELLHLFREISHNLDCMLKTKKQWYEQGSSRKQALKNQVFSDTAFSEKTLLRWGKEYQKDYPYWEGGYGTEGQMMTVRQLNVMPLTPAPNEEKIH